jgi:hypothetical protein
LGDGLQCRGYAGDEAGILLNEKREKEEAERKGERREERKKRKKGRT